MPDQNPSHDARGAKPATAAVPKFAGRSYPVEFQQIESEAIRRRRAQLGRKTPPLPEAPPTLLPADTVGIACSGGGIRSATFCLGVFQSLAAKNLLGHLDFMSTVSGGGYFGSFYGAWLNRGREAADHKDGIMDRTLSALRTAAHFLTLGHVAKEAAAPENDPSLPPAAYFESVRNRLNDPGSFEVRWLRRNGRYLAPNGSADALLATAGVLRNWLAVHFVLLIFLLLFFFSIIQLGRGTHEFIPIAADWFGLQLPILSGASWCELPAKWSVCWSGLFWLATPSLLAALLTGTAYWFAPDGKQRNRLTRWLASSLAVLGATLLIALVDTVGCTLWTERAFIKEALCNWIKEIGGVGAVVLLFGRRLIGWLQGLAEKKGGLNLPVDLLISGAALLLAGVWFVLLDTTAHALTAWTWKSYPVLVVLALLGNWSFRFVNLSSQANFYGSRLTRAYLGASNPHRQKTGNQRISDTIEGDNIAYADYRPDLVGGPLHLINVTVNETVDGRSGVQQADRKGFNLAVGPAGLSAGVRHHAAWEESEPGRIKAIPGDGGFHCFATRKSLEHTTEPLDLGQWVGISGAAFSTGIGARTNPALSFLCGFFNIRLGWWWNSGVVPAERRVSRWLSWLPSPVAGFITNPFAVQEHLLHEFQARFYGTARQRWYLSDGGHFENTAAYELIRRRVPFIIICDDGCDPDCHMEDFANLVRKARLDFNAEIAVLPPKAGPDNRPKLLGTLEELANLDDRRRAPKAALLARVRYLDGLTPDSLILLIKPTVTGIEPVDILHYQTIHRDFPQQSTLDQFYDEEQWESYRKVGQLIADDLFAGTGRDTDMYVHFEQMV